MPTFAALLLLALVPLPIDVGGDEDELDAKEVERIVEALEKAFRKGDAADRIEELNGAVDVPHEDVVDAVESGLTDREPTVVAATIECLRFLDHEEALEALHKAEKSNKKITKDDERHAQLLKAIGQHGRHESIEVLADDVFGQRAHGVVRARILGLGNIRHEDSVEELIALMNKASRRNVNPYMRDVRLALAVLTGRDEGKSVESWMRWWNDHKKELEVSARPPKLPKGLQQRWDNYWGIRRRQERGTKRGDRGK